MTNLGLVLTLALIALCLLVISVNTHAVATKQLSGEKILGKERSNDISNSTTDSTNAGVQDGIESEEQSGGMNSDPPTTDSNIQAPKSFPTEKNYCNVKLVNVNTFHGYTIKAGTNNADQLFGTSNKDLILGLDGNDMIYGSGDDDIICGGKGDDVLYGESYRTVIMRQPGSPGNDVIFGQEGNDYIVGGLGNDFLRGGIGDDKIDGAQGNYNDDGDGNDLMDGGPGNDYCEDLDLKTFVNCEHKYNGIVY